MGGRDGRLVGTSGAGTPALQPPPHEGALGATESCPAFSLVKEALKEEEPPRKLRREMWLIPGENAVSLEGVCSSNARVTLLLVQAPPAPAPASPSS